MCSPFMLALLSRVWACEIFLEQWYVFGRGGGRAPALLPRPSNPKPRPSDNELQDPGAIVGSVQLHVKGR